MLTPDDTKYRISLLNVSPANIKKIRTFVEASIHSKGRSQGKRKEKTLLGSIGIKISLNLSYIQYAFLNPIPNCHLLNYHLEGQNKIFQGARHIGREITVI